MLVCVQQYDNDDGTYGGVPVAVVMIMVVDVMWFVTVVLLL